MPKRRRLPRKSVTVPPSRYPAPRCIASLTNGDRCPANAYKGALVCGFHGGAERALLETDDDG